MLIPVEFYDPRRLWPALSFMLNFFTLFLCAVSLYTGYISISTLWRVPSLNLPSASEKLQPTSQAALSVLQSRLSNLRQLLLFTFYLFAFCLLLQVPSAFNTLSNSKNLPIYEVLMNLGTLISYATDVTFIFLVLHCIQWSTSYRLHSIAFRISRTTDPIPHP